MQSLSESVRGIVLNPVPKPGLGFPQWDACKGTIRATHVLSISKVWRNTCTPAVYDSADYVSRKSSGLRESAAGSHGRRRTSCGYSTRSGHAIGSPRILGRGSRSIAVGCRTRRRRDGFQTHRRRRPGLFKLCHQRNRAGIARIAFRLHRRKRELLLARHEAQQDLRSELRSTMTALLLSCEMALNVPNLPVLAETKMRAVDALAKEIRTKLALTP